MTRSTAFLALVSLLLVAPPQPAAAELCAVDPVPAATLLLPYFEVSLKKNRTSTVFSLANSQATPTVAHVTLWTDWSIPTLSFDVFLTGYDVETFDLKDLFDKGLRPQTAHAQNDPADTLSPHGGPVSDNPTWDSDVDPSVSPIRFPGCDALLPPVPLDETALDRLRNSHTGREMGSGCVGFDHGDDVARGYITIDNALDCTLLNPTDPSYLAPGGPVSNVNQLWGEWWIAEKGKGIAAAPLVAIEATDLAFIPGDQTFYGRLVDGLALDDREPLGTVWATQTTNEKVRFGKPNKLLTNDVIIWRDNKEINPDDSFACGAAGPPWFPLDETQIVRFDEQEQVLQVCGDTGIINPRCAPLATQRIASNEGHLEGPFTAGWIYWNLNHTAREGLYGNLAQSHVSTLLRVKKLRGSVTGAMLSSACHTP